MQSCCALVCLINQNRMLSIYEVSFVTHMKPKITFQGPLR